MVYPGRPSRGCITCIARKVKVRPRSIRLKPVNLKLMHYCAFSVTKENQAATDVFDVTRLAVGIAIPKMSSLFTPLVSPKQRLHCQPRSCPHRLHQSITPTMMAFLISKLCKSVVGPGLGPGLGSVPPSWKKEMLSIHLHFLCSANQGFRTGKSKRRASSTIGILSQAVTMTIQVGLTFCLIYSSKVSLNQRWRIQPERYPLPRSHPHRWSKIYPREVIAATAWH